MTPGDGLVELSADIGDDFPKRGAQAALVHLVDPSLLSCVTSVNVVCGEHAGDVASVRAVVEAAVEMGLRIGAHPSWPDDGLKGRGDFVSGGGVGWMDNLRASLEAQLRWFGSVVEGVGGVVRHVKPHGGLYHAACADIGVAGVVLEASRGVWGVDVDRGGVALVGAAGSVGVGLWRDRGVLVLEEGFSDRRYVDGGGLLSRGEVGAVITDAEEAARQAVLLATGRPVRTVSGGAVTLGCSTICVHGDTPGAVVVARRVREALLGAGVLRVG